MHAAAMAEAVRPGRLIIEIQFLEAQIESPNYIDNQLGVLFGLVGSFLSLLPFDAFYLFNSYVSAINSSEQ